MGVTITNSRDFIQPTDCGTSKYYISQPWRRSDLLCEAVMRAEVTMDGCPRKKELDE
jgi:hypothetical protein